MNCGEFDQRMQRLIDDRTSLTSDDQLLAHAECCDDCHDQLQVWQQIATVMPSGLESSAEKLVAENPLHRNDPGHQVNGVGAHVAWSVFVAVAAVLLMAFMVSDNQQGDQRTPLAANQGVVVDEQPSVDPARWWRDVQDRDWLAQTMPAVQSVREGVAPLGRSLKHALAILTTGSGESAS